MAKDCTIMSTSRPTGNDVSNEKISIADCLNIYRKITFPISEKFRFIAARTGNPNMSAIDGSIHSRKMADGIKLCSYLKQTNTFSLNIKLEDSKATIMRC